jgi:hypothetical protein
MFVPSELVGHAMSSQIASLVELHSEKVSWEIGHCVHVVQPSCVEPAAMNVPVEQVSQSETVLPAHSSAVGITFVPDGQQTQVLPSALDTFPAGHAEHSLVTVVISPLKPSSHLQSPAATFVPPELSGHGLSAHTVLLVLVHALPTTLVLGQTVHAVHDPLPAASAKNPSAHSVHTVSAVALQSADR